ncbi:MAG: hypothetical protein WBG57_12465 [Ornithinimicrobium sp.]
MPVLPASVRVALWASSALNGVTDLESAADKALPDMDDVSGLREPLATWRDVGERVVLVALPRPGRAGGMPSAPAATTAAAAGAEEAVFVPGLGGALVPEISAYGPADDEGWQVQWSLHPADPMPAHVLQALDVADAELRLRQLLARVTDDLEIGPGAPMARAATEIFARRRIKDHWGMPPDMPSRPARIIELAGSVVALADIGLSESLQSVDASNTLRRETLLRELQNEGLDALTDATNVAAVHYARWL